MLKLTEEDQFASSLGLLDIRTGRRRNVPTVARLNAAHPREQRPHQGTRDGRYNRSAHRTPLKTATKQSSTPDHVRPPPGNKCGNCDMSGHYTRDCFMPGGQKYSLATMSAMGFNFLRAAQTHCKRSIWNAVPAATRAMVDEKSTVKKSGKHTVKFASGQRFKADKVAGGKPSRTPFRKPTLATLVVLPTGSLPSQLPSFMRTDCARQGMR